MKYSRVLSRRTLLRGAGTVVIGLPFLEEMRVRSVYAAPGQAPVRAIDIFFGEGMPNHVQEDFLAGMTDRYAQQEYRRLFHPSPDP